MEPLYALLYNAQTEFQSKYVLLEETRNGYKTMNPITYFWLKMLGKEDEMRDLADDLDYIFFTKIANWEINRSVENKYQTLYGPYFNEIKINAENLEFIPYISQFLEFYQVNSHLNQLERIKASLVSHKINDEEYIKYMGPVLTTLCHMDGKIEKKHLLKSFFDEKTSLYNDFLLFNEH